MLAPRGLRTAESPAGPNWVLWHESGLGDDWCGRGASSCRVGRVGQEVGSVGAVRLVHTGEVDTQPTLRGKEGWIDSRGNEERGKRMCKKEDDEDDDGMECDENDNENRR